MNTSVVAFAAILIIGGIVTGVNLIIVLGVFLLIPGLLASPRKRTRIPVSKTPQPRTASAPPRSPSPRSQPPIVAQMPAQAQQPSYVPMSVVPAPSASLQAVYAPPLFPTAMFPTLSLPSSYRQPAESKEKQPPPSERDELLEFGLLIAVLKLVSG